MEFAGYEWCNTEDEFLRHMRLINQIIYFTMPLDYKLQVAERGKP